MLPIPRRMRGEFATPNAGPGFRAPTHRPPRAGIPAPGFVTKLSYSHGVSGVAHLPLSPHPFEAPRFGCSRTVASPAQGSAEATGAPRAFGPRRRPAGPRAAAAAAATAGATAAPARSCSAAVRPQPREAQSQAPTARRVPAAATHLVFPPGAARTGAGSLLLRQLSQLRGAGDPPSLQDGRGFPPSGRFEGRELPSWSDRDGGRGFPCRNDKVGGDSPELCTPESLGANREPWGAGFGNLGILGGKDPGRWQLRISRWRSSGRHLGGRQ